MKQMFWAAIAAVVLAAAGCGADDAAEKNVSVYIGAQAVGTTAAAEIGADLDAVWITLKAVNLCSDPDCTDATELFAAPDGRRFDLMALNDLLQYLATTEAEDKTYNRLELILGRDLEIEAAGGDLEAARFATITSNPKIPNIVHCPAAPTADCAIRTNGAVQPFALGRIAVSFDLKAFEVEDAPCTDADDPASWCVTQVKMHPLTPAELPGTFGVIGTVTGVGVTGFTFAVGDTAYLVTVDGSTACDLGGDAGVGDDCLLLIEEDACVLVRTPQDPGATDVLTAESVEDAAESVCAGP